MKAYIHENILHKRQFDLQFSIRFEKIDDVNFYSPFHWHNHFEILYVIDGEIDFRIEDRKILLGSNDVIIVNSEVIHSSKLYGHVQYILLQVPVSAFNGIFDIMESIQFIENPDKKKSKQIAEYLQTMLEYIEEKKPEHKMKFISLLYDFLYMLLTEMQQSEKKILIFFLITESNESLQ